ncbi:MAG: glycerate kinase type-2 family protein [Anaerolineae bacterium]
MNASCAVLRRDLATIRGAALSAVDPAVAVRRHLARYAEDLIVSGRVWRHGAGDGSRVLLLSVGKAAVPMACAAVELIGEGISDGFVVTKHGHSAETELPPCVEVIEAGHPIPDDAGLRAGRAITDRLETTTEDDLVLLLLSGGGSALLPAPVPGVTLEALQSTTDLLLRAGANIVEINAVRKHLSLLKGGQLARRAMPARVMTFILSDVVGNPLDVIASGPTAPDPTTYEEAVDVLRRYKLLDEVPEAVRAYLMSGLAGDQPETPKPGDAVFHRVSNVIVGSNYLAAEAAVNRASELGYRSLLLTTFIEGEAREVAKVAVALAKSVKVHGRPVPPPACLVWGGETTVTVSGPGKGGRNQELALAASLGLEGLDCVAIMALATDGTDGPTDAAGGIVNGDTARQARKKGWDLHATLAENNAYALLDDVGALLRLGPTGTNVNDLLVLLVR